jgi:hypothetical protein
MIDRNALTGFGQQNGNAVVTFEGGQALCYTPEWRGDSVRRITRIEFSDHGKVVAKVEAGRFWSACGFSQEELAAYCAFAIDLERDVYRRYRAKKIDEVKWQKKYRMYWKIVIKSRQAVAALERGEMPILS